MDAKGLERHWKEVALERQNKLKRPLTDIEIIGLKAIYGPKKPPRKGRFHISVEIPPWFAKWGVGIVLSGSIGYLCLGNFVFNTHRIDFWGRNHELRQNWPDGIVLVLCVAICSWLFKFIK